MRPLAAGSFASWLAACLALGACADDDAGSWAAHGAKDGGSDASVQGDAAAGTEAGAAGDAGFDDAASAADAGADADAAASGPVLYPAERTHSPITPWVAAHLSELLERDPSSRRDVFMKVGDSITASSAFLHCFAGGAVELGSHAALQPTLELFKGATVLGTTPFERTSLSVEVGRTAYWAMTGQPSPLTREMEATHASVAVAMYGTNDIGWFGADHLKTIKWYHDHMFALLDALAGAGIIPIVSTIPPRDDSASHNAWVPTMNAVIRGMAQGRQVPLVDLHRELLPLAGHGLSTDGVHPKSYAGGACKLTADGLAAGYNVRNLLTLQALERVRRAVLDAGGGLEAEAPMLSGEGSAAAPFVVSGTVFTDVRSTAGSSNRKLKTYSGCGSSADESGPEFLYKLTVDKPSRVRALVLDRGEVDIDLHLLDGSASEAGCLARDDTMVQANLAPGSYFFSLDTFTSGGVEKKGEYLFVLLQCSPGDPACEAP